MRSKNRLALLLSTILCAVLLVFGMAACGGEGGGTGAKEAIDMYIFSQTLVDADFTLPKRIGKNDSVAVQWKSSNTDAIAIEDNGENYKAIVTLQDEVTEVTLTISSGEYFKDFKVNVNKLDVYTFMAKYTFAQRNTAVTANFDLDTETTFQGKKATIAWSIDEEYAEYIKIEGNKVIVTPAEDLVAVKIKATFTYNGENATQSYSFNVAPALEHRQTINRYYSVESYPLTFSGYITHLVEASESYGNATFYMIDDDFCSGYYAYRVKINTEDIAKYVDGAHVTVTGDTTKNYNGLWENNGGGTATVDDTAPINPREKVYALDTDLLSGVPSMIWHESTFVSLSGWKVLHKGNYNSDSKTYEKTTSADQNLFTLEKNGTEIVVRITKYAQRTDEELAALVAWYDSVNEGEYINVVGLLGNYNAFQIQPILASDITKATAESTNTDGAAVKAAVAKVKTESDKNFGALLTTKGEFTMPTSEQGVTISYRVAGADAAPTVTIDGGKITVDPVATEKNYDIEVTYKIGDYEAYSFFKIRNFKASATDLLALAKENVEAITLSEVKNASSVTIPTVDLYEAQISWAIENAPTWASVAGNVVTISELPTEATTLTLKATLTLDGETTTATITLAVAARPAVVFNAIEAPAAGDYIFALYQGKLEKWLYSTGIVNSNNFGETTENYAEAALFTLAASGDGWTIQLKSDGKYLELNSNHRMQFVDASTQAWKWDATYKVFTFTVGSDTYYLGTYNDFNTISASTVSYLSSSTNFVGHFGNMGSGSTTPSGDKGTENNPYTVAEILDLAKDLADGSYLQADGKDAYVYIKGYVTDVGKIYETYGLSTVMIADEKGGTPAFKLYTINWGDAMPKPETIPENSPLTVGDFVVCHGFVKNYKGEIEVDKDSAKSTYPTFTKWEPVGGGTVDPEPTPPAEEDIIYTLSTMNATGSNNGYASNCDIDVDGVTWNVEGNSTMNPWRFGGKDIADQDRKLTAKTAVHGIVKKIEINFGAATITVNKVTLYVFSTDPMAEGATPIATKELTFTADGTFTVEAPAEGWNNCFYQIVFNVTNSTSSNQYVQVKTVVFHGEATIKTDEEKVAEAKAALKLSTTALYVVGSEVELPAKQGEATVTYELQGTTDLVKIENGKLVVLKLPEADTEITLKATLTVGEKSDNMDLKVTVKAARDYGTAEKPLTIAAAIELAGTIGGNGYLGGSAYPVEVYVKGFVIAVDGWDSSKSDWTKVYIADTNDTAAKAKVQLYRLGLDDTYLKAETDLVVGAQITVFGCLQNYNGNAEVSHNPSSGVNCKAVAYTKPEGTPEPAPEPELTDTWLLVEDVASLKSGAQILLVYETFVNGELSGKYLKAVSGVEVDSATKKITKLPAGAQPLTLGQEGDNWTLSIGETLLGLTKVDNNSFASSGTFTSTWTISIAEGVAQIASTLASGNNTCRLQCNANSGQERFSNYKTSTQKDPSIYMLQDAE